MTNPTTPSNIDVNIDSHDEHEATFVPTPNRKSRQASSPSASDAVLTLPVDKVKVVRNIRTTIDKKGIEQLAASIRNEGQLTPIVVQKIDDDTYGIVFGHRRHAAIMLNAAKHDGDGLVRCTLRNNVKPEDLAFIQLAENIQREDMRDSETAVALAQLKTERNISTKDIATRIGLGERQTRNYISIGLAPDFIRSFLDAVEVSVKVKDSDGKQALDADGTPIVETRNLAGLSLDKVLLLIAHHSALTDAEATFIKTSPSYKPKADKQTRALAQQCAAGEWTKQELADRIKRSNAPSAEEPPTAPQDSTKPAYRFTKDVIHMNVERIKQLPHAERRAMVAALQAALINLGPDIIQAVDIRGA